MLTDIQFLQAFEAAIPGFKATEPEDPMPRDDPEDTVHWIERMLGESFCCQVRWKDLFGELDGLNDLQPIQRAGIQLSIDELFDEDGNPIDDDEDEEPEPDEYFLPVFNRQLAPAGLRLIEVGLMDSPRLVCVRMDAAVFDRLVEALVAVGLAAPAVLV